MRNRLKQKEWTKQWLLNNPEKVETYRKKSKERYEKNKKQIYLKVKEWRSKNKEKVKGYSDKWKLNNPEKARLAAVNWTKKNPEKVKENRQRYIKENPNFYKDFNKRHPYRKYRKYGTNIEEIAKIQEGKCAICKEEKRLCVDHCHTKLKIRGLLCISCNAGLGCFYDNVDLFKKAIEYLNKYNE